MSRIPMPPSKLVKIPELCRIKPLSKLLKRSSDELVQMMTYPHKKSFFMNTSGVWFRFERVKDVIVPFEFAAAYGKAHKGYKLVEVDPDPIQLPTLLPAAGRRVPVVAVLGHYDHGKTTLVDYLGKTQLAQREVGGITQEVRTITITLNPSSLPSTSDMACFVDTPGQDIFYRMRNYGASVADVGLLVLDVTEGIRSQTEESIGIMESLKLPTLVALNKIDTIAEPNQEQVVAKLISELREYVALENAVFVPISAKNGTGVDIMKQRLWDLIVNKTDCVADQSNSNSDSNSKAVAMTSSSEHLPYKAIIGGGTVLDAWTNPRDGSAIHIVLRQGQVSVGDRFCAGGWSGTVRQIIRDGSQKITKATVGMGCNLILKLSKESGSPTPMGDSAFFYPASKEELAEEHADMIRMEHSLANFVVSAEDIKRFRLNQLLTLPVNARKLRTESINGEALINNGDSNDGEDDEDDEDEEDEEDDDDKDSSASLVHTVRVVLKADTDLALSTICDAIEEAKNKACTEAEESSLPETLAVAASDSGSTTVAHKGKPYRFDLATSSVGEISYYDVMVAKSASGYIFNFGVQTNPMALRSLVDNNVKVINFGIIGDIIKLFTAPSVPKAQVESLFRNSGGSAKTTKRKAGQ